MPINKGVCVNLCGLPSSGKSWFVKLLADRLSSRIKFANIHVIDIDRVRSQSFETQFLPENEAFVRETAILQARGYLESKSIVIIDDINYYNSMRHEFKQIADELGQSYLLLYISTPLKICLEWNKKRKNFLEDNVIRNIAEKFDIPGQKYLWDTPFDVVDISTDDSRQKINTIVNHIETIALQVNHDVKIESTQENLSVKHEIDLLTRMFINFYAKTLYNPDDKIENGKNNAEKVLKYKSVLRQVGNTTLFRQIQDKFTSNIGTLNTKRRNYMENTQFDELVSLDWINEKNLIQILVGFMKFLQK